jgi:hypothetical protein
MRLRCVVDDRTDLLLGRDLDALGITTRAALLLTHGAKPTGPINNHPAARAQIANMKALRERSGDQQKPRVIFDYSRKIRGLTSLPQLARFLNAAREQGSGMIVMDNISRLFAACDVDHRRALLDELLTNKDHFFGLRQGGTLSGVTHTQLVLMASGRETTRFIYGGKRPRSNMSEHKRQLQTTNATIASRIARGRAADSDVPRLSAMANDAPEPPDSPPNQRGRQSSASVRTGCGRRCRRIRSTISQRS